MTKEWGLIFVVREKSYCEQVRPSAEDSGSIGEPLVPDVVMPVPGLWPVVMVMEKQPELGSNQQPLGVYQVLYPLNYMARIPMLMPGEFV